MSPPDFKKKHKAKQSARLDNGPGTFSFNGKSVKLPKIGVVKTHEALRFDGRPLSATVSFVGDRWWLSVQVELPEVPKIVDPTNAVGIDLGLTTALALSTGEKIKAPKPLKSALERLKRLSRAFSRKAKGSNHSKKAARKLARLHWRIGQIRKNWQHQTTTNVIAKRFSLVCVEDLNVKGMMANHKVARSISDIGWAEIGRQLKYKCAAVQEVGRFYPSSKLCNDCGQKVDSMPWKVRKWTCACGEVHDRDINAALNIEKEGLRLFTASCAGINACGVEGSGLGPRKRSRTKPSTVKQELGRTLQMSTN
jgi:putative transposase